MNLLELYHPGKVRFVSCHVQYVASVVITGVRCLYEITTRATDPSCLVTIDAPTV